MSIIDRINAPQFSLFDDSDDLDRSAYFDFDHEFEYVSPSEGVNNRSQFRRSLSLNDIFHELSNEQSLNSSTDEHENGKIETTHNYIEITCKNLPFKQARSKGISQENLCRLAQPKQLSNSNETLIQNNFVSVAEAIKNFHQKTPQRYHSKGPKIKPLPIDFTARPTFPQSPNLNTKNRSRPVHIQTQNEKEALLMEEMKKCKIRANPVNKKILKGPMKAVHVEKKPATILEPFKLTEVIKKNHQTPPKNRNTEFHANPVPKYVLNGPWLPKKESPRVTVPVEPSFMRQRPRQSPQSKRTTPQKESQVVLTKTQPMPFSFEKRDQMTQKKKERFINQFFEEEKKAREFHARPIPKKVSTIIKTHQSSTKSNRSNASEEDTVVSHAPIKARPATVLKMKPFEPKKGEHPLIEIKEFNLNTDRRAKEREDYEENLRKEKMENEKYLNLERNEELLRETEEIRKQRREAEFKAHPVRKYKEIHILPSLKVTEPISPMFRSGKKNINKENVDV